jgi:hypothetical protein
MISGFPAGQSGGLTMAAITHVFTISREDEDWLDEICIELDPEDGRLTVWDLDEDGTTAFTRFGIDNLTEVVQRYKAKDAGRTQSRAARRLFLDIQGLRVYVDEGIRLAAVAAARVCRPPASNFRTT